MLSSKNPAEDASFMAINKSLSNILDKTVHKIDPETSQGVPVSTNYDINLR